MRSFLKKYAAHIYFLLFFLSVTPFFLRSIKDQADINLSERYSPKLQELTTISSLNAYIDSVYRSRMGSQFDTATYVNLVSETIKERFYFGIAQYSFTDNWLAYSAGKILWSHFMVVVKPEDILKHSQGLCSQQSIVFFELLKAKNISTRSVGLGQKQGPGHFISEVWYDNGWHLFDVTMEPDWEKTTVKHASMDYYMAHKDTLYRAYSNKMARSLYNKITSRVHYGEPDEFPARKMMLFHTVCQILIYLIPLTFLFLGSRAVSRRTRETELQLESTQAETIVL